MEFKRYFCNIVQVNGKRSAVIGLESFLHVTIKQAYQLVHVLERGGGHVVVKIVDGRLVNGHDLVLFNKVLDANYNVTRRL